MGPGAMQRSYSGRTFTNSLLTKKLAASAAVMIGQPSGLNCMGGCTRANVRRYLPGRTATVFYRCEHCFPGSTAACGRCFVRLPPNEHRPPIEISEQLGRCGLKHRENVGVPILYGCRGCRRSLRVAGQRSEVCPEAARLVEGAGRAVEQGFLEGEMEQPSCSCAVPWGSWLRARGWCNQWQVWYWDRWGMGYPGGDCGTRGEQSLGSHWR